MKITIVLEIPDELYTLEHETDESRKIAHRFFKILAGKFWYVGIKSTPKYIQNIFKETNTVGSITVE